MQAVRRFRVHGVPCAEVQREEQEDAQKEAIRRDRMAKRAQEINRHVMESAAWRTRSFFIFYLIS